MEKEGRHVSRSSNSFDADSNTHAAYADTRSALRVLVNGAEATLLCALLGYVFIFFLKIAQNAVFGTANYGILQFVNTVLGFASVIASIGAGQLLITYLPKYRVKNETSLVLGLERFAFWVPIMAAIIVPAILFFASNVVAGYFGFTSTIGVLLAIGSIFLPVRVLAEMAGSRLVADEAPLFPALSQQILDRAILFFGLGICIAGNKGLGWYILVIGASYLFQLLFLLVEVSAQERAKGFSQNVGNDSQVTPKYVRQYALKEWLIFSLPLLASGLVGYFFEWTDYFTVAKFFDPTTLGIYDLTYSLAAYLLFMPGMLGTLFIPVLTRFYLSDKQRFASIWRKLTIYAFIAVSICGTLMLVFARELLVGLYGPIFASGIPQLQFLSLCFIVGAFFAFTDQLLLLMNRSVFLFVVAIICGVVDLFGNILVAYLWHSAALIALCTGIFYILLRMVSWWKVTQIAKKDGIVLHLPWMRYGKIFVTSLLSAILCRILVVTFFSSIQNSFLRLIVILFFCVIDAGIVIALLHRLRLFSWTDLRLFLNGLHDIGAQLHLTRANRLHPVEHSPHHATLNRRHLTR